MKHKILSFIYDSQNKLFLALYSKPHPEHGPGGWFTVTGGVEEEESEKDAVKREVKEETELDVLEIFDLNWGSVYKWKGEECKEMNYISFVEHENVRLNEEHSKYEWLGIDEFIDRIAWNDDKALLMKVLEKAIKKEIYFNKKERGQ